ncbi:MAG: hypothetical protein GX102_05550 [Porphyromonadaceae bacterium]|jgi:hypothetical protein|nr:hypothetical protein [Porphyromonadaceae bacterium]
MKSNSLFIKILAVTVLSTTINLPAFNQVYIDSTDQYIEQDQPFQDTNQQYNEAATEGQYYYKWETPILEKIDLKSIEAYQNDHEKYLTYLETVENVLKKNRQELNSFYRQAKDHAKVLKNERKNLKEKRRFYKKDEKLMKREKSLRDREYKLIQKERKTLRRQAKNMSTWDVDEKMRRFDDREYRIEIAEEKWNTRRESNQLNLEKISEDENTLNARDMEIKERIRELDFLKRDLDLQGKQLKLEQRQTKLEIKKAKAAMKKQSKSE